MAIRQLSVFLENKKGQLSETVKLLAQSEINIRALSIAEARDFGILRLIVSDTDKAKEILSAETIVKTTAVIAVKMDDKEGALYKVLQVFDEAGINVEYSYAFTTYYSGGAYVVFRVDDAAAAELLLTEKGFELISEVDV